MQKNRVRILAGALGLLTSGVFAFSDISPQNLINSKLHNSDIFYTSTDHYLDRFDIERYQKAGTDFFNDRYSPNRLNKPLDQIDSTYDYPFAYLESVENRLRNVDRRQALEGIFKKITSRSTTNLEMHLAVLDFLQKVAFHNPYLQPMYPDRQAVYDPIVLIELGEMRCGGVARVGADLFASAGFKTRLVQVASHVTAEIFYDGKWHLFEADLLGGEPLTLNGVIPSVRQLSAIPFAIDKTPSHFEFLVSRNEIDTIASPLVYPSFFFFSKKSVEKIQPTYYLKTASPDEAKDSKWYGWNYYREVTNRWKLTDFEEKYEPSPPIFNFVKSQGDKFVVGWLPAKDYDNDLLGYRVYVSSKSRGWNYEWMNLPKSVQKYYVGGWEPEMYWSLFKEPQSDLGFYEVKSTEITLKLPDSLSTIFVTIMAFDKHGESVGRTLYNMSAELSLNH